MPDSSEPPIVVDLDGTLITSDLLVETASDLLVRRPAAAPAAFAALRRGKAELKQTLATGTGVDIASLPYREDVLAWLREQHAAGRTLILASASDARLVRAVAEHLGIFDEVLGSENGVNLRSEAKRDALVDRYGSAFEYVGNHRHDLPVWAAAGRAHVVGDDQLIAQVRATTEVGATFPVLHQPAKALIRSLRPHQWVKNALVFLPLFTAQMWNDIDAVLSAVLALVAFCAVASGVYVLNDLADIANDRQHPTKRNRPFASGALSPMIGWLLWPILTLIGLGLSFLLPLPFTGVLVGYLVLTLAYTFSLKRRPVLDVLTLGGLYTIRIVAGAAAIAVAMSMWLLTFSLLFFLSLALLKRVSELTRIRKEGSQLAGRGYLPQDLELVSSYGVATSIGAVVIFALYVDDPETIKLYDTPELLWGTVPVLLAWLMRAWLWAHRGEMNEDPIVFAIKDVKSIVCGALIVAAFAAAKVVG